MFRNDILVEKFFYSFLRVTHILFLIVNVHRLLITHNLYRHWKFSYKIYECTIVPMSLDNAVRLYRRTKVNCMIFF